MKFISIHGCREYCLSAQRDSSTLLSIAFQSPIDGGDAVYSARVMLGIDPNNSSNRIMLNDYETNLVNEIKRAKVYPNPNNGTMQVYYSLQEGKKGEFVLYELTGRKIKTYRLNEGEQNVLVVSEEGLQNGVYFYEVLIDNNKIDNGKIVIIK